MTRIKISSQNRKDLHVLCRSNKGTKLKKNYETYSRILSDVIKIVKKLSYNKFITNSNNKAKTTWDSVKTEIKKKVTYLMFIIPGDDKGI